MKNFEFFLKMFLYVFVTTIITFCSLVDTISADSLSSVSGLEWMKIILKSLVPGLVSLKAFLDTTVVVNKDQSSNTEDESK
jgi:hypothetical protein